MSLIPSTHSRFAWFQTGLFGGAGRGGPGRLVVIGGVLACMAGGAFLLSVRHGNGPPVSQVDENETWQSPAGRDAGHSGAGRAAEGGFAGEGEGGRSGAQVLYAAHSQFDPLQRRAAHRSRDGGSRGRMSLRRDLCLRPRRSSHRRRRPTPLPSTPCSTVPLARTRSAGRASRKSPAGDVEGDETSEEGKSAREQRQKAIGDLVNSWSSRPPQTTVVIEPTSLKQGADDPPAKVGAKGADSGVTSGRVLVPAGRGIYAHTVVAVDLGSGANGRIWPAMMSAELPEGWAWAS